MVFKLNQNSQDVWNKNTEKIMLLNTTIFKKTFLFLSLVITILATSCKQKKEVETTQNNNPSKILGMV